MRKKTGVFRTTPIAALETELAILPVNIRLDQTQRMYAMRTISMPATHPIRKLLPETFPGAEDQEEDNENRHTHWYQKNNKHGNRLDRNLSTINKWIQQQDQIESTENQLTPP